jgi:tRNA-(ms[2]io[6]A)-hydroxylase
MAAMNDEKLPLRYVTPIAWANAALTEPLALLNDHAHLEKKAATNALELLSRWPEPVPPENWVQSMTAVARDEVEHLAVVTRLLSRRGGKLTRSHHNAYASALHKLVRRGKGPDELVDRLLISALIEARSCERFALLGEACDDRELAKLYKGLWASEAGHYRVFLGLARDLPEAHRVDQRWDEMLDEEVKLITAQPPGAKMHSGLH